MNEGGMNEGGMNEAAVDEGRMPGPTATVGGGGAPVLLMGPTGAGKTALALQLSARLPFALISADSAMVYRGMDIGTGKPPAGSPERAAHRLIDIRDPEQSYSAGEFRRDALAEMHRARAEGLTPLLVGGTRLYFQALRYGLAQLPRADSALRARLKAEAAAHGWPALHARLARVDPRAAARIHPRDAQRIERALEVWELGGRPMSELVAGAADQGLEGPVRALVLAPAERASLHGRIAERLDRMLELGLVDEVRGLAARPGVRRETPSMRAVGYRQVWDYLEGQYGEGRYGRERMRARAVAATRQLARRQLTWLRAEHGARWFDADARTVLDQVLNFLVSRASEKG